MAVTVLRMSLLSITASVFTSVDSQVNAGYFGTIEDVDVSGTNVAASWKKYEGVTHRLRCLQSCLVETSCQSIYYDETSASCYINSGSVYHGSSNVATGLSYAGYLLRCNSNSKCSQLSDYSAPFANEKPSYSGCGDAWIKGNRISGVYSIDPDGAGQFQIWCDFMSDGAWAVFQRRLNGQVDFYKGWLQYKNGFGDVQNEYWLGGDRLYRLTYKTQPKLNIYMEDCTGASAAANYSYFGITNESSFYQLSIGSYSGNAGDSMQLRSANMPFSTYDADHDGTPSNCAQVYHGAWWYGGDGHCFNSHLNGGYLNGSTTIFATGVIWGSWTGYYYSLKTAIMRILV